MPGEELGGLSLHVDTLVGDGIVDPFDDSFQRLEAGGSLGLNSGEVSVFLALKKEVTETKMRGRSTDLLNRYSNGAKAEVFS